MTKNENRRYFLEKRQEIPSYKLQEGVFKRNHRFFHFLAQQLKDPSQKKHFFVFYSCRLEPSTHELIAELLDRGHRVSLPRMRDSSENTTMEMVGIQSLSDLTSFYQSIPQPPDHFSKSNPSSVDMVIVPSLALDSKGFRLGYGGGFYDRLMAQLPSQAQTIAWQYEEFCDQTIPLEPHDLPVQYACTEENWREF